VIDVVENHRPLAGCDSAGETAADGDTDALLDLLLDPDRCPRHELIRLLVEQQDSARVDTEDVAGAEEERRKENLQLQMRERRIRERLELAQAIGVVDSGLHRRIVNYRSAQRFGGKAPPASNVRFVGRSFDLGSFA
jgi:hypothetical protein